MEFEMCPQVAEIKTVRPYEWLGDEPELLA